MNIFGYTRVSTADQAANGLSLDAQSEALHKYCDLHGLALDDVLVEAGASAKSIKGRPVFTELLAQIREGDIAAVIVVKMDRAFRNIREALEVFDLFAEHDTDFHSVREHIDTSTAMGRFFRTQLLAMGQFEREQTGERVSEVLNITKKSPGGSPLLDARKAEGKLVIGRNPYGYVWVDGDLVEEAKEGARLVVIRDLQRQGLGPSKIATHLNSLYVPTRSGSPWHHEQVRRIIQRGF